MIRSNKPDAAMLEVGSSTEVNTDVSLSIGTLPTTESTMSLNLKYSLLLKT